MAIKEVACIAIAISEATMKVIMLLRRRSLALMMRKTQKW
jgi:hypothetical protein